MITANKWLAALAASCVVVCLQIITTQYGTIAHLRQRLEFVQDAHRIEMSQIADLQYQLEQVRDQANAAETAGFVSGVVDAIQRRDYYTEIWHSGYTRGTEVQQYANQLDRAEREGKTAYTATDAEPVKD